jgi:predicted 3-demethylubiquinone-9 3-methyltransferase (glyoxalase superfamily)
MTLDYSSRGKVKVTMIDYIKGMLDKLPSNMSGVAATAATVHLFKVNKDNAVMLDKETSTMFHHNMAKLLFVLCKRARTDTQTAVAFSMHPSEVSGCRPLQEAYPCDEIPARYVGYTSDS